MLDIRAFYGMTTKQQIEEEVIRQYLRSTDGKELEDSNLVVIALTKVVVKCVLGEEKK